MDKLKESTYKDRDAGHKEIFSMFIYRPFSRFLLWRVFRHLSITPNQVSALSLLAAVIGSGIIAFCAYPWSLTAILFLHLSYTFDTLDGQLARYKGLTSKFGKWFDPFLDVNKTVFIFAALSYKASIAEAHPTAFLWGIAALTHSFLTFYIMNTRSHVVKELTFEVKLKDRVYLGYEVSLYWVLSLVVLLDRAYEGLILLGTLGAFSWVKAYITLAKSYYANRDTIEREK